MKKQLLQGLKGFFTTYALTTVFHTPFFSHEYETFLDYIIASVYEILGEYQFQFVLLWILSTSFYHYADSKWDIKSGSSKFLACFFSLCLLFGKSYHDLASWDYCFGSAINFIKFCLCFCGYTTLFYTLIGIICQSLTNLSLTDDKDHFFMHHAFAKAFAILAIVYFIPTLISYPGTLCWDVIGQIEQVTKNTGYSAHHPLAHTLLVGGLTQLGYNLFGTYEPGLFVYMIIQVLMLAAALAMTIAILAKRNVKCIWLCSLLLLYCISPIYTNIVSVAIKDVPYSAFTIGYGVCFFLLMENPSYLHSKKYIGFFLLMQLGTILMRNNGLVMILLTGVLSLIYIWEKYNTKEKIQYCLSSFVLSIVLGTLLSTLLVQITNATETSAGEMLSIPFQQTARYLQLYGSELSLAEQQAIEEILGSVEEVAQKYDPESSDPVKALYDKTSTTNELISYLGAWATGLFKHPLVYIEAFFAHIYGWFTPGVSNAIRYETDLEENYILQKALIFFYRFADRISLLSILQNVGAYVWGMFFITFYHIRNKKHDLITASIPLWISLLVCMLSPCYIYHPRYALPILFLLPFLYVITLSSKEK